MAFQFKGWTIPLKEKFPKKEDLKEDKSVVMFAPNRIETKIMIILLGSAEKAEDVPEKTFTHILEECKIENNDEWKRVNKILDVLESVGLVNCTRKSYLLYIDPEPRKAEERLYKLTPAGFVFASLLVGLPEKYPFIEYSYIVKTIHQVDPKKDKKVI